MQLVVRYRYALSPEHPDLTIYIATRHARRPARYVDATGLPARDYSTRGWIAVTPFIIFHGLVV